MNNTKNKGGRPPKFDEDTLLQYVKVYVERNKTTPILIKNKSLVDFLRGLGLPIQTYDIPRYRKVKEFIDEYNAEFKKIILGEGLLSIDDTTNLPIYERVDVQHIVNKKNAQQELVRVIEALNLNTERLTDKYSKLQKKHVILTENSIQQKIRIEQLERTVTGLEQKNKELKAQVRLELDKDKLKLQKYKKQLEHYDYYIIKYHYDKICEYAMSLDERLKEKGDECNNLLDSKAYESGVLRLSDVVAKYEQVLLSINNQEKNKSSQILDHIPFIEKPGITENEDSIEEQDFINNNLDDLDSIMKDFYKNL